MQEDIMSKKIIVVEGQVLFQHKDKSLYYEGEQWTKPGEKGYSLEETEEGIIFRDHFLGKRMDLDFAQFEALAILMKTDADLEIGRAHV